MDRIAHIQEMEKKQKRISIMISASVDAPPSINLAKIVSIDNRVYDLLERARKEKRRKDQTYINYRKELEQLVGWTAKDKRLKSSDAYEVAHRALCEALRY